MKFNLQILFTSSNSIKNIILLMNRVLNSLSGICYLIFLSRNDATDFYIS